MDKPSMAEIRQARQAVRSQRLKRSLAFALIWGPTTAMIVIAVALAYRSLNPPEQTVTVSTVKVPRREPWFEAPKHQPKRQAKQAPVVVVPNGGLARLKRENEKLKLELEALQRVASDAASPKRAPAIKVKPKPDIGIDEEERQGLIDDVEKSKHDAAEKTLACGLFKDLLAKARTSRKERNPVRLLRDLKKLKKRQPKNPMIQFGLGEVYASFSPCYSRPKARVAFRKFLEMTKGKGSHDLCGKAEGYLDLLKHKGRLFLVTPRKTLLKVKGSHERRIRNFKRRLRPLLAERRWLLARRAQSQLLNTNIRLRQGTIEILEDELGRIEMALDGLKASHCEEEKTTSRPHRH